jgi:hypothetical protein
MTKKMLLAFVALCASSLYASEFRAPVASEQGPLRYDIVASKDKYSLKLWSAGHYRTANKAFDKHGTGTKQLTNLFFGKETFTLAESFEGGKYDTYWTENRNPQLDIVKFSPRASYAERGITFGGQIDFSVWDNHSRAGLRFSVPFKTVRIERDDEGETQISGVNESIVRNIAAKYTKTDRSSSQTEPINAYKMKLLTNLKYQNPDKKITSLLVLGSGAQGKGARLGATEYKKDASGGTSNPHEDSPYIVLYIPNNNVRGREAGRGGADNKVKLTNDTTKSLLLDKDGAKVKIDEIYGFDEDIVYKDNLAKSPNFDHFWMLPVVNNDGKKTANAIAATNFIEDALAPLQIGMEEWLVRYGDFMFATHKRSGLGDAKIDLFYEHHFADDWRGEASLGLKLPTGQSSRHINNPYQAALGNGNHFELCFAGNAGWATPWKWMNVKGSTEYAFVLNAVEKRAAVFKDSTVKNIGPKVDADVDWHHFTGRLDMTLFHRKFDELASVLGYEFYYKTKDGLTYRVSKTDKHWLGKRLMGENGKNPMDGKIAGKDWEQFEMELDNNLARKDTEQIAHRIRLETNWRAHKYCHFFVGGTYTFAGKHAPRELDAHGGLTVRF